MSPGPAQPETLTLAPSVAVTPSVAVAPRWLRAALSALALEAVDAQALVNEDPFSSTPRTFLVVTAGGERLKVRRGSSARAAERSQRLAERLADPRIPAPVHRRGRVTFATWVEGTTLSSLAPAPAHIDAAADLLASIHRVGPAPHGRPQLRTAKSIVVWVGAVVERLLAGRILDPALARQSLDIVRRGMPARARWGLTHMDLSPTNLVLDPGGRLVCIDSEHLQWGFADADLARAWVRWPLRGDADRRFEARYRAQIDSEPAREVTWAWRTVAAMSSVDVRDRHGGGLDQPLARLRETIAGAHD